MVVLKQVDNVKYAQFVEPGQTLTVTAELLKLGDGEAKLKAYGTVGGRIIVSAGSTLACYNLADSQSAARRPPTRPSGGTCGSNWLAVPAAGRRSPQRT